MKDLRPFSLTAIVMLLFCAWIWIGMSSADYSVAQPGGSRKTAGWFILGFPFIVVFGLLASLLFSLIARRSRPIVAWGCVLAIFPTLIAISIRYTTPEARVQSALGVKLPADTEVIRVVQQDSFNAGITYWGICTGDQQFLNMLITHHALQATNPTSTAWLNAGLHDQSIPKVAILFENDELMLWYDSDASMIYFYRHDREL